MDSTRASAIRLLTSSKSIDPPRTGEKALKPAPMWRSYIVSSAGVSPRSPYRPLKPGGNNAHSPPDDRYHHFRRICRGRRQGAGPGDQNRHRRARRGRSGSQDRDIRDVRLRGTPGVGVTGWCWGGSTVYQVASTNHDIKGAVAWYGPPARPYQGASGPVTGFDLAKDIHCPFLGLYGETDQNPKPEDAKRMEELTKQHNKNVEIVIYPGAGHGFHADYRPSYNAAAAQDAWKRCTDFFAKNLKA